ncbi:Uncharacterised protein [Mycobacteroides abscessus subsp. abscessus]|nr:Uncharacterised protein [Mycobacteroides abscessus subsp. abscessus]
MTTKEALIPNIQWYQKLQGKVDKDILHLQRCKR